MGIVITQKVLIITLLIAVILLAGYIGADKYNGYMVGISQNAYVMGYQDGMSYAVQKLMLEASTCNPVPVRADNETMNLIAIECLQQG